MAKENVNPDRACPACAKLREEFETLRRKVEAIELAAKLGPNTPRCACGKLATRAATPHHALAGDLSTQLLCDACDATTPANCTIAFETLPPERLELVRRVNAGLG